MSGFANGSLGEWLDGELATAPNELAVRLRSMLPQDWRTVTMERAPSVLADAAATELRDLLQRGCDTRWAAPGLLAVDALVTFACEALAISGGDIGAGTADILERVTSTLPQSHRVA
ncbi:MAG TPA: hypothetical protein VIG47_16785 [Gemmatimonadaceae bacterium]